MKRSGELIMILEAPNPNFYDQTESSKYPGLYMRRLGGRHGKKTANGANAYTNMAFFDGHMSLFPTAQFNIGPASNPKWPPDRTRFWLGNQKGK